MEGKYKVVFLGKDNRQISAAAALSEYGYLTSLWGESGREELAASLKDASAVVLPLPASLDGITLNARVREGEESVRLGCLLDLISESEIGLVLGGRMPEAFVTAARQRRIKCIDYFASEYFQEKNAYITAEAALSLAMKSIDKTIREGRFALTGYGRIASRLAGLLRLMGGEVTVAARKESAMASAELLGCSTLNIGKNKEGEISQLESGYDVIFNTVPSLLFGREFLEKLDKGTLIIELASSPGGIDADAARALDSRVLWASALPSKYAPASAGALVAECIRRILDEEAVRL